MDVTVGIEAEAQRRRLVAIEMWGHQQGWYLKAHAWAPSPEEKGEQWARPGLQGTTSGDGQRRGRDGHKEHTMDVSSVKLLELSLKPFYSWDPYRPLEAAISIYFYLICEVCFVVGFLVSVLKRTP